MFHTLIVVFVVVITLSLLTSSWLNHRYSLRSRSRRLNLIESSFDRRFYKRTPKDPEEQYIEGIGIIIGDLSCTYNARSPYIRCAVNPDGLCQDCRHYHHEEDC